MQTRDNSRLKALLKLLETETDQYADLLKEALASAIKANPGEVQRTLEEEFATSAPRGVVRALEEICWDDLAQALSVFAAKINPDLLEGLMLLAKFTSPTTARGEVEGPLENMVQTLRPALLNSADYPEIIQTLSHFIFTVEKFQILPTVTDVRDTSFPRFLARKQGSPLNMVCLYLCLAQRFGLEMDAVDMAGKLLLHLHNSQHETSFLIDPLDNGKLLNREDCNQYLLARGLEQEKDLFEPLSSRMIIRRAIANMIFVLNKLHDERRLTYLRNYLEIIKS